MEGERPPVEGKTGTAEGGHCFPASGGGTCHSWWEGNLIQERTLH